MVGTLKTDEAVQIAPVDARVEEIEVQLLLDAVLRVDGYDYRDFDASLLRRRITDRARDERVATISALQERVLHDDGARARLLLALGGGHRELFHESEFFARLRTAVVPLLQTYSFVRIWMPTAGSGEDAYALACLLQDAGLFDRCVIYATPIAQAAVDAARRGVFPIASKGGLYAAMRAAGIIGDPEAFVECKGGVARFHERLCANIMFAQHDLSNTASINEFHAIVARRVLPLFNAAMQYQLHRLFLNSLARLGFLCLGRGESLAGTVHERAYRRIVPDEAIYRRMR